MAGASLLVTLTRRQGQVELTPHHMLSDASSVALSATVAGVWHSDFEAEQGKWSALEKAL